jgi:methylenetetrahydrofolate reductase (NADPH)
MKLIDKINREIENNNIYYSFEYFPPKTKTGLQNLYFKLESMSKLEPLFIDITWGAGGSTSDLTMEMCKNTQNVFCLETQMHLTCTNINEIIIRDALNHAKDNNIRNILALRGDAPYGNAKWTATDKQFKHAIDLVKFIRKEHGEYFSICVAGYPEGHPDGDYETDLKFLKDKIDAGADFIITQLFYDVNVFIKFVKDCRKIGIQCPILPGILPIINYNNFKRMVGFCKVKVPEQILSDLEIIKNDDKAVSDYGIELAIKMCEQLINNGIRGLHIYTLNRIDSCQKILQKLNLLKNISSRRALPWKPRIGIEETVRPIFWNNTKKYYIDRTSDWDKFPNGRWGNKDDAQYGDLNDYHLFGVSLGTKKNKLKIWGNPQSVEDVTNIFVEFLNGKIKYIPWCDHLASESNDIHTELININKKGYMTINSQPKMNGIKSSDSAYGWGGNDGYLYQKAYVEFFCSKENLDKLLTNIKKQNDSSYPTELSYCAINNESHIITNCEQSTIAVTWGIFPNKQVVQPTIVDYDSFLIWKNDALKLWANEWATIYDNNSESYKLIKNIHDTYYLVYVVDNDYINGNIFDKLFA